MEDKKQSIVNACTQLVPAEALADHILKSTNKKELVMGLINDKRNLTTKNEEMEQIILSLQKYERSSTAYIHHLITKLEKAHPKK
jgi:hypothetical protein